MFLFFLEIRMWAPYTYMLPPSQVHALPGRDAPRPQAIQHSAHRHGPRRGHRFWHCLQVAPTGHGDREAASIHQGGRLSCLNRPRLLFPQRSTMFCTPATLWPGFVFCKQGCGQGWLIQIEASSRIASSIDKAWCFGRAMARKSVYCCYFDGCCQILHFQFMLPSCTPASMYAYSQRTAAYTYSAGSSVHLWGTAFFEPQEFSWMTNDLTRTYAKCI